MLPFTRDQFIATFGAYNEALWPVQVLAYLLGIGMVGVLARPSTTSDRIIGCGLAAMWVWTGIAYHGLFFSAINKAALLFGALFVLQGLLMFHAAVMRDQLRFASRGGGLAWAGWALVLYAAIVYPIIGLSTGHAYPAMPMFGITPCPVVIFTFGLLLLTTAPVSRWLLVIPLAWSLIGGSAAFLLGVAQDWALLFSAAAAAMLVVRDRAKPPAVPA